MPGFMDNLKSTLNDEKSITENGAVGYKTTGKKLLDLNFKVSSLRNRSDNEIIDLFTKAFYEDKLLAVKWLFYVSDVREGMGERRLFRVCMKYLAENHSEIAHAVLKLIPEYNRWDNAMVLLDTELCDDVIKMVMVQMNEDIENMKQKKSISLLMKWLPSRNTSSRKTRQTAQKILDATGLTAAQYRKILSKGREYLNIVERKMSAGKWSEIDYSAVPSRANLVYNAAFLRHDETRRREYLSQLQKGETKINAGVLFPHDIVHKYFEKKSYWQQSLKNMDAALEEMWKALPDYVNGNGNTICVADGSGSMTSTIGGTNVSCLDVANALAIYFSEKCSGQFKNQYITFSERPQLVDFSKAKTLREKLEIALRHNEVANTNIEAVFDLLLWTAIRNNMPQEEMPKNVLILSDMEFDSCVTSNSSSYQNTSWGYRRVYAPTQTLFDAIAAKYAQHGYKLPRLVFWNICSRTGTIPVKENDLGVALVSGFSPAIVKMVLSNSTDPFECLLEQINAPRYDAVEKAIKDLVA